MNNTNATTGIDIGFKYGIIGGLGLIAIYLYVYFTHNFSAALLFGGSAVGRIVPTILAALEVRRLSKGQTTFRDVLQAAFAAIVVTYIITMFFDYFLFNYADAAYIQLVKNYWANTMQTSMQLMGAPPEAITDTINGMRSVELNSGFLDVLQQLMYKIFFGFLFAAPVSFLISRNWTGK